MFRYIFIFLALLFFREQSSSYVIQENVVFKRTADVTTSDEKWTISVLVETKQYDRALNSILERITFADQIVAQVKPSLIGKLRPHLFIKTLKSFKMSAT